MKTNRTKIVVATSITFLMLVGCELNNSQDTSSVQKANASLTETYWKLDKLNGKAEVMVQGQAKERHVILHSNGSRMAGFSGCNQFFGQYEHSDESQHNQSTQYSQYKGTLQFNAVGATKMACPSMEIDEQSFLNVFAEAVTYEISEETLTFITSDNKVLATFSAVYF